MKESTMAFMAIIAVAAGITGTTSFASMSDDSSTYDTERSAVQGHITAIQKTEDGQIRAYIQTDNIIVNNGIDCMGDMLFDYSNATESGCGSVFQSISLTDGLSQANATDTFSGISGIVLSGNGLGTATGTVLLGAFTNSTDHGTTAGSGTTQGTALVNATNTFSYAGTADQNVDGAALSNGSLLFALQKFGSAVTLNENDTLEIEWAITLG